MIDFKDRLGNTCVYMHACTSNSGQGFDSSWPAPQPPSCTTPLVLFLSSQSVVWIGRDQGGAAWHDKPGKAMGHLPRWVVRRLAVWQSPQSTQSRHDFLDE